MSGELLEAEGDAVLVLVELENLGFEFLTNLNDFARVADATPGEVRDVEETVDATEVDEGAVVGDVLDDVLWALQTWISEALSITLR